MIRLIGSVAFLALACLGTTLSAQDEKKKDMPRFGYDVDEFTYSQKTPADAMASIARAIDRDKVDYLIAQLADPTYVDYWIERYMLDVTQGKEAGRRLLAFDRLVRETSDYLQNDPLIVRDLRGFARDGKWEEKGDIATGTVESIPARKVFLKKIGERWFLKNEQQ